MSTNKNKHIRILILILGSFIGSHLLFILFPGVFDTLDLRVRDYAFQARYQLLGGGKVYHQLVHVDINDSTKREIEPHEWDHSADAKVVNVLTELNVGAIAYDIVFSEPTEAEEDQDLIDAVSGSKRVYFPVVMRRKGDNRGRSVSPQTASDEEEFMKDQVWKPKVSWEGNPLSAPGIILPFRELRGHEKGIGHINASPDRDGVHRRLPLLYRYNDGYVPSLTFRMVCDYVQVAASDIEVFFGQHIILHDAKLPYKKKEDIIIPIDEQGKMIVNFAGPWGDPNLFHHFNYAKLFNARDDNELLDQLRDGMDGVLVVVANVSTGSDIGNTPIQTQYPLSGVHTNVANTILTKNFLYELSIWKQVAIDTSLMALTIFVVLRFSTQNFIFVIILVLIAFLAFASYLFFYHNILTNIVRPQIGLQLSIISVSVYSYIHEIREKTLIRHKFECYFAPSTLNKILQSRDMLKINEKKVLTILFSDISGFTLWSDTQTPEEIRSTLNEYLEEMSKIVFKYEGTIDKYMGDGLMAFYGDPFEKADQTLCAVKTAIEMQQKTRELKRRWQSQGRLQIKIRIGINRGEAVVGNMGSEKRMDYTVIGSTVNIAQRLEGEAPVEGILISETVQREVKGLVKTKFYGKVALKGVGEELDVYEVKLV